MNIYNPHFTWTKTEEKNPHEYETIFFSIKYSLLILFSCFKNPLIPSEEQNSAAVWAFAEKLVVKLHFDMLETESIHLQRFELIRLNLTVWKAFLSLPSRFWNSKWFVFMRSIRQCSLKYENQSFTQNISSNFCTRCFPFIYIAITCTDFVEIIVWK